MITFCIVIAVESAIVSRTLLSAVENAVERYCEHIVANVTVVNVTVANVIKVFPNVETSKIDILIGFLSHYQQKLSNEKCTFQKMHC